MMKKYMYILPVFFVIALTPTDAEASLFSAIGDFLSSLFKKSPLQQLTDNIVNLAQMISNSTAKMMKFGDMLICNSLHGAIADTKIPIIGVSIKLVSPFVYISGLILYFIGFMIMMMSSYYLFDAAFNLSIAIVLLPLSLALWPFGWTRDKLKTVIDSILYYVGVFIFLPLGVLIAQKLAFTVVEQAFSDTDDFNFMQAYQEDNGDLIEEKFTFYHVPFLKVLLCYIVAIRIIPLLAGKFCQHFFGNALVGNPINEKIAQASQIMLRQGKKIKKYGSDVLKHQAGSSIERAGLKRNGYLGRVIARYGKNMAKTRR